MRDEIMTQFSDDPGIPLCDEWEFDQVGRERYDGESPHGPTRSLDQLELDQYYRELEIAQERRARTHRGVPDLFFLIGGYDER